MTTTRKEVFFGPDDIFEKSRPVSRQELMASSPLPSNRVPSVSSVAVRRQPTPEIEVENKEPILHMEDRGDLLANILQIKAAFSAIKKDSKVIMGRGAYQYISLQKLMAVWDRYAPKLQLLLTFDFKKIEESYVETTASVIYVPKPKSKYTARAISCISKDAMGNLPVNYNQFIGATISYSKRYAFYNLMAIAPDDDNDLAFGAEIRRAAK